MEDQVSLWICYELWLQSLYGTLLIRFPHASVIPVPLDTWFEVPLQCGVTVFKLISEVRSLRGMLVATVLEL